jgi:radical SAM protein with 4Fe4S-binding SPASM domain
MNPKKKFFLFKQSKHFCAVPWNHIEVWSDGKIRTCSSGSSFGNINSDSLESILSNSTIRQIKHNLVNDQFDNNCTKCHQLTTPGEHFDLRNHYNPMFQTLSIDYDNLDAFNLNAIDLHWDNTCNFKCVYCNPEQSSLIAQEQNLPVIRTNNDNIDKIIKLIVENQYNMKELYLSGGEPLLVKHNFKLLKQITNTDLPIRINSNISHAVKTNLVFDQLTRFKNVHWTLSADAMEDKFNYIRSGGNWDDFLNSIDNICKLEHKLRINMVWFVGSADTMFDTIRFFVEKYNITDITINQLDGHPYLQVRNAPNSVKESAKEKLSKLLDSNLIKHKSNSWYNIARCAQELEMPSEDSSGYASYFNRLDQLRGTNWRHVFPELV